MNLRRLSWWITTTLLAVTVGAFASLPCAYAQPNPGLSQLGGFVYIDRNNDGIIAFSNQANPEYAIDKVTISLFSKVGNVETPVSTTLSDANGRYLFPNLNPGTYVLRQTQPVEMVDGLDTLGILQSWNSTPIPPAASAGTAGNNFFTDIVLTANVGGEFYNFGERGLSSAFVSKRYLFASAPALPPVVPEPGIAGLAIGAIGTAIMKRRSRV